MYVRVTVVPGARTERVAQTAPDRFSISVREPAAQNQANRRVRELIAEAFGVEMGAVRILTGHRSTTKIMNVAL